MTVRVADAALHELEAFADPLERRAMLTRESRSISCHVPVDDFGELLDRRRRPCNAPVQWRPSIRNPGVVATSVPVGATPGQRTICPAMFVLSNAWRIHGGSADAFKL